MGGKRKNPPAPHVSAMTKKGIFLMALFKLFAQQTPHYYMARGGGGSKKEVLQTEQNSAILDDCFSLGSQCVSERLPHQSSEDSRGQRSVSLLGLSVFNTSNFVGSTERRELSGALTNTVSGGSPCTKCVSTPRAGRLKQNKSHPAHDHKTNIGGCCGPPLVIPVVVNRMSSLPLSAHTYQPGKAQQSGEYKPLFISRDLLVSFTSPSSGTRSIYDSSCKDGARLSAPASGWV